MSDYIAYFMIYIAVAFLVLPLFGPKFCTYAEGVKVSFAIQGVALMIVALTIFIAWPLHHLGWL